VRRGKKIKKVKEIGRREKRTKKGRVKGGEEVHHRGFVKIRHRSKEQADRKFTTALVESQANNRPRSASQPDNRGKSRNRIGMKILKLMLVRLALGTAHESHEERRSGETGEKKLQMEKSPRPLGKPLGEG